MKNVFLRSEKISPLTREEQKSVLGGSAPNCPAHRPFPCYNPYNHTWKLFLKKSLLTLNAKAV